MREVSTGHLMVPLAAASVEHNQGSKCWPLWKGVAEKSTDGLSHLRQQWTWPKGVSELWVSDTSPGLHWYETQRLPSLLLSTWSRAKTEEGKVQVTASLRRFGWQSRAKSSAWAWTVYSLVHWSLSLTGMKLPSFTALAVFKEHDIHVSWHVIKYGQYQVTARSRIWPPSKGTDSPPPSPQVEKY